MNQPLNHPLSDDNTLDPPGEIRPVAADSIEPAAIPAARTCRKRLAQGGNLFLAGLFASGLICVYVLSLRTGPARASTEEIQVAQKVDMALLQLRGRPSPGAGREGAADVADVFYYEARHRQIAAKELPTNPFVFKPPQERALESQAASQPRPRPQEDKETTELSEAMAAVKTLTLQSVMSGARGATAMISNNVLTEGQSIHGWTVVEIRPQQVVLRWKQQTYVVRISE